jgi:aspartyl-tRNA(Asn)/glutamyl-tRNA(Gln) amidotransferase subunit A
MTFQEWQQLSPAQAASTVHERVHSRLSARQRRAAIASLASVSILTESLERSNSVGALYRVPYFIKDLFSVSGEPTYAGSTFLPEVNPAPTADCTLQRTLRSAGAVYCGKTHLHEFAYGITGENPHYGDCEHPQFPGRTTGGSSSGSAAIVAAGVVPFAIGTDTGGSIRLPAAFCGLYGFRLTPRDRFIQDAFPLAPSFDTAGWFTKTGTDMATSIHALVGSEPAAHSPRGCYLELPGLDADVAKACRAAAERFAPMADRLTQDDLLSRFAGTVEPYNQVVATEAWRIHVPWADHFRDRYDPAVWQRLQRARDQSAADYERALAHMSEIQITWTKYFLTHDFLILPATPFGALLKEECTLANRLRVLGLTAPASLGGLPVLTIPVALPSGLTCGLQIVAKHPQSGVFPWAAKVILETPRRPTAV